MNWPIASYQHPTIRNTRHTTRRRRKWIYRLIWANIWMTYLLYHHHKSHSFPQWWPSWISILIHWILIVFECCIHRSFRESFHLPKTICKMSREMSIEIYNKSPSEFLIKIIGNWKWHNTLFEHKLLCTYDYCDILI